MDTWAYLVLIAALLILAGAMLRARFVTRSREKSLHHAPSDWCPVSERFDFQSSPDEAGDPAVRAQLRLDRVSGESETPPVPPISRDYLDELQEAAAGLAKLMRSSPAARPEPVVYAPGMASEASEASEPSTGDFSAGGELVVGPVELGGPSDVPVCELEVDHDRKTPTELLPGEFPLLETEELSPEPGFIDVFEEQVFVSMEPVPAVAVMAAEDDFEPSGDLPAPKVLSLRELLGDAVADQFDRIDAGLDALQDLVSGIEANLILLSDYESVTDDADSSGEEADRVAAAA
jgi:hypothetical protein